jgi:peptidoglycan/LPS O-acetylase OafA/YrhL
MTAISRQESAYRYQTLDAWRGIAALSVLAFHCVNTLVIPGRGLLTDALLHGWLGVFVFFPISGYCILAATCSPRNATVAAFLWRRWLRIFPTYWASLAVAVLLLMVLSPLGFGSMAQLSAPGWKWLSIITLTQTLTGLPNAINPVYWSLCYEEQFYLVVALSLAAPAQYRRTVLLGISAAACAWRLVAGPIALSGWFVDFWLEFAVGMAVFGWSHPAFGRTWATTLLALNALVCVLQGQLAPVTSTVFAVLLLTLRRWDAHTARMAPVRALAAVGVISYSVYLIHVPIAGRVVNGVSRLFDQPSAYWGLMLLVAGSAALSAAWIFYRVVESRFLRRGRRPHPAAEEAPWVADPALAG